MSSSPVDVDAKVASSRRRHRLAQQSSLLLSSLSSSLPPDDVNFASYHRHCHARSSLSLPSSPPLVNVARHASKLTSHPTPATATALAVGIWAVFGIIVSILKSNTCNWWLYKNSLTCIWWCSNETKIANSDDIWKQQLTCSVIIQKLCIWI